MECGTQFEYGAPTEVSVGIHTSSGEMGQADWHMNLINTRQLPAENKERIETRQPMWCILLSFTMKERLTSQ